MNMDWMKWTTVFLYAIIDKFKGGPVGITTIATAVGEEAGTLEEVYEPFLDTGRIFTTNTKGKGSYCKSI